MKLVNTPDSFGFIAKTFHWLMAVCIIGMLILGVVMTNMPPSSTKMTLYAFHKSTGLVMALLVTLRLIWRLRNPVPELPKSLSAWHHHLAKISSFVLYIFMILLPFSGILLSQAAGHPISFYGIFRFPMILPKNPDITKIASTVHGYGAFLFMGILIFHIIGGLYHHFILKNNVLKRMLPSWRHPSSRV